MALLSKGRKSKKGIEKGIEKGGSRREAVSRAESHLAEQRAEQASVEIGHQGSSKSQEHQGGGSEEKVSEGQAW